MNKKSKNNPSVNTLRNKKKTISLFDKINSLPERYSRKSILLFFLSFAFFLSLINFNARISEANDDALYIESAYRFVTEFPNYFHTVNAPFYPMFLAILMKLFGFKIIVFKLFNILFFLLSVYFFFITFFNKVPFLVFLPAMFFVSANHQIIYFSSMTFTESLFMFLQSLMFYFYGKVLEDYHTSHKSVKYYYKSLLLYGLSVFLLVITRSVAIVLLPAILFFFWVVLSDKKLAIASFASFLLYYLPYKLSVRLIFGDVSQYSNQSKILLQKDPYDASLGQEDISGFIQRFFDNSELYLSKRFFQIIGWMDAQSTKTHAILALMIWTLLILTLWKVYKQKKYLLFFPSFYTIGLITLSFIILQARWDQPRIIMVAMPIMILNCFFLFFSLVKSEFGKRIYLLILFIFSVSILTSTIKRGIKNIPIVTKNLQGDIYYGYTPDWQNFLKASEWCGKNLPSDAYVASRKAPMSFIYGKRKFFPIYSVIKKDLETNQSNPDSAIAYFKQNKVTHILLPNLRIDPNRNTGQVINTIHNILEPIARSYPNKLKLIHTEGETEPCYVYEFVYDAK